MRAHKPTWLLLTLIGCGGGTPAVDGGPSDTGTASDGTVTDSADGTMDGAPADSAVPPLPTTPGGPVILFSDLTVAPNSGWSSDAPGRGAVVTVWGRNLGGARGESFVSAGGAELRSDADYAEAWGETGQPVPFLQRVSFWLNDTMAAGATELIVTVDGETSNALPFTIGGGNLYFIDGDAGGDGSGTHSDPWSSPSSFVSTMAPGDIGYFREAVYDQKYNGGKQNIWLRPTDTGGTREAPIAFVGYPGEVPIFDSRTHGDSGSFHTSLRLQPAFITVAKLSIDAHATGISVGDDSRIIGNDVRGGAVFLSGTGIIVATGNASLVYGNAIHGGRTANRLDHGIYISGCAPRAGNTLAWNHVFDNSFDRGPMIVVNHQEERCPSDAFVRSHFIHHNFVDCSDYPSRGVGIYDLSWDGAPETEPEAAYVYDNVLTGCGTSSSPAMYQNAAHAHFYNNTLHESVTDGVAISGDRVLSSSVVNNIIELTDSSASYIGASAGDVAITHNLYFGAGDYSGADPAPVNGDPLLVVDRASGHVDLAPESPAIDQGTDMVSDVVRTDFRSVARPSGDGVDIGAIEWVAPSGG